LVKKEFKKSLQKGLTFSTLYSILKSVKKHKASTGQLCTIQYEKDMMKNEY